MTSSSIIEELNRTAKEAGIQQKEATIVLDPVEGSETLSQMTISAGIRGHLREPDQVRQPAG